MQYQKLNPDQQEQMLDQRISQYEHEHYNHQINKDLLIATGADDDASKRAIEDADKAMATLDAAHAETVAKLEELKGTKGAARAKK